MVSLVEVLEKALADRIFVCRASMDCRLFPLRSKPQRVASVTSESLDLNFDVLLVVITNFAVPGVDAVRAALKTLDLKHERKLSNTTSKAAQASWAKTEGDKLLDMCRLVRRLQWRSPGRSSNDNIGTLKLALVSAMAGSDSEDWPEYPDGEYAEDHDDDDNASSDFPEYPGGISDADDEPETEVPKVKPKAERNTSAGTPAPKKARKTTPAAPAPLDKTFVEETLQGCQTEPIDMAAFNAAMRKKPAAAAKAKAVMKKPAAAAAKAAVPAEHTPELSDTVQSILEVIIPVAEAHMPELTFSAADKDYTVKVKGSGQGGRGYIYQVMLQNGHKWVAWTQTTHSKYGPTGSENLAVALKMLAEKGYSKDAINHCKTAALHDEALQEFWDV